MTDVLKLAEDALELVRGEVEHSMTTQSQEAYVDALTAIRTARAEWDWRKIADAPEEKPLRVGMWIHGSGDRHYWWSPNENYHKRAAIRDGYEYFFIVPPPPAREEVGNVG